MTEDNMQMREAFEAWFKQFYADNAEKKKFDLHSWWAWQAATAAAVGDGFVVVPRPVGYRTESEYVTLYYPCGVRAADFLGLLAAAPKAQGGE